ncbi:MULTISPECIES: bifunctional phosphopantothenoylcysteine decarboxylase/phosphopantothenate--cysteine ligase CoaBC [Eubacteriales]|uniref:bifunctional phosphopantothenoylcysteine decarboxylase/phosphopantothenate--cysteine ligase CoaBC n=1 Tax=Eubacteriales TaxID=186802 RepID=UPI000B38A9DD|nr:MULTISPECIES: bifunctional phosphopantothenoylcysteine decarboxylase/phosphopantothenate--cysteine ligase CoaBC [Eubacteriales]OUN87433.1 phosphopantothenoylcysteine decarboxylase [Gemmiger sp. An50]
MLKGKHVVLAVTGGIAAYKMATMASLLVKQHADVQVLMTQNATNFINPITFETLTGHKCLVDTFDRNFEFNVEHVSVAKQADIALVAPATANVIGKLANGLADDMLTTTLLACKCKKLVAPAMNTQMYENPIVQDNMKKLEHYGMELIQPVSGHLACGDSGMGKMVEPEVMLQYILRDLALEKDMKGLKVLVTAGPTQEAIDPVRYITNHSTGTMGYQLARNCMLRGAQVTLVTGRTALTPPPFVEVVPVVSAQEMYEAVTSRAAGQDIIIKAAAVADYRPATVATEKIKKAEGGFAIPLERTQDILRSLGEEKHNGQFLCGFAMETQNLEENARKKLEAKNLDLVVGNNVKVAGAGFGAGTNVITFITKEGAEPQPQMDKAQVAGCIVDKILAMRAAK